MDVNLILQRLALGGYALAALLALLSLILQRRQALTLAPFFALAGLLLHLGVGFRGGIAGRASLDLALSILTLLVVGSYLFAVWRYRLHVLGIVLLPMALVLYLFSGAPGAALPVAGELEHPLLWLHIAVSTLGVAALFLTFSFAIIYLVQERALKEKKSTRFFLALPSLSTCDRVLHGTLGLGFALLTIGIVLATIWSASFRNTYQVWQNQRETLALISWAIFGIVLYARIVRGWHGRRIAILSIVGFTAVLLRLLGGPFL